MSWAKDEWKNDLPPIAFKHVDKLEQNLEALKKDKQQRSFQLESLEAALAVQKRKNEEEKSKCTGLQRELQSVSERYDSASKAREKLAQEIHLKDSRLNVVEGQLQSAKQAYESEKSKCSKLVTDLEKEHADRLSLTVKLEKITEERGKLIEMNNIQRQKLSSGGSSSDDTESLKVIANLEKKLKVTEEELESLKKTSLQISDSAVGHSRNDLMLFEEQPGMEADLMCFDEPSPPQSSCKTVVNLLETDDIKLPFEKEQAPVTGHQLSDVNRILEQTKVDLAQAERDFKKKEGDLVQLTARLEKESSNNDSLQKKIHNLIQEMDCQRHNSEAARVNQEERTKERERQLRQEMASQRDFVINLEKEFAELQQKSQQEVQCAKNKEAEVTSQLSRLQHEHQVLTQTNGDVIAEKNQLNAVLATSEKKVCELTRESKCLNQQKDSMVNELESANAKLKRFEVEIGILKGEIVGKENAVRQLDSELKAFTAQIEKLKNSSQKDVNNLKVEADRARRDFEKLQLEKSTAAENLQRAEIVIKGLENKVKDLEENIAKLTKDALIKDRDSDIRKKDVEAMQRGLEESREIAASTKEETHELLRAHDELKKQLSTVNNSYRDAMQKYEASEKNSKELTMKLSAHDGDLRLKRQEIENLTANYKEELEKMQVNVESTWAQKLSDCDSRRAALESECHDLKGSADLLKKESMEVRAKLVENEKKLAELEKAVKGKDEMLEKIIKENEDVIARCEVLRQNEKNADSELCGLKVKLTDLHMNIDQHGSKIEILESEKTEMMHRLQQYEEEEDKLKQQADEIEAKREEMDNEKMEMMRQRDLREAEKEEVFVQLGILKQEKDELDVANAALKKRLFEMENLEEEAKTMIEQLDSERGGLKDQLKACQSKIEELNALSCELNEKVSELKSSEGSVLTELESVKKEYAAFVRENGRVAQTNAELLSERIVYQGKIKDLQQQCEVLRTDVERYKNELTGHEHQKDTIARELAVTMEDNKVLRSRTSELECLDEERKSQMEELLHEKDELMKKYEKENTERDCLKVELSDMQVRLSEIQSVKEECELKLRQSSEEEKENREQLVQVESEVCFLKEERKKLMASFATLNTLSEEKDANLEEIESKYKVVKEQFNAISCELKYIQEQKTSMEGELRVFNVKCLEKEEEKSSLKAKLDGALLEASKLKDEVSCIGRKLKEVEGEKICKEEMIRKLETQTEMQQMDMEDQREILEERDRDLDEMKTELIRVNKKLKNAMEQLKEDEKTQTEVAELYTVQERLQSSLNQKIAEFEEFRYETEKKVLEAEATKQKEMLTESMLQVKVEAFNEKEKENAELKRSLDIYDRSLMHKSAELEKMSRKWEQIEVQLRELSKEKEIMQEEKNRFIQVLTKERDSLAESWQQSVEERDHYKSLNDEFDRQLAEFKLSKDTAINELEFANSKYDDLSKENEKIVRENNLLLNERSTNFEKIKDLEEKYDEMQISAEKSSRDFAGLQRDFEIPMQELGSLKNENLVIKKKSSDLEYLLEVLMQEKAETCESLEKTKSERDVLSKEFADLQANMTSNMQIMKEENEGKLDEAMQEKQEMLDDLIKVKGEMHLANEERDQLAMDVAKLESAVEVKELHASKLEEEKTTLMQKLDDLAHELEIVDKRVDIAQTEVGELTEQCESKDRNIEALSSSKEELAIEAEKLKSEMKDLIRDKTVLSEDVENKHRNIESLSAEIDEYRESVESSRIQIASLVEEKENLLERELSLTHENADLKTSLKSVFEELSEAERELSTAKISLSNLEEEKNIKDEEMSELKSQLAMKQMDIESQCETLVQRSKELHDSCQEKEILNVQIAEALESCEAQKVKIRELEDLCQEKERINEGLNENMEKLEGLRCELQKTVEEVERQKSLTEGMLQLRVEILSNKEKEIEDLTKSLESDRQNLLHSSAELDKISSTCKQLEEKICEISKEKETVEAEKNCAISEGQKLLRNKDELIEGLMKDKESLNSKVETLTENHQSSQSELLKAQEMLSESGAVNDNLTKEVQSLKEGLESAKVDISGKTLALNKREMEVDSQSKVIVECQNLAKGLRDEIQDLQSQIARINAGMEVKDKENARLVARITEMENQAEEKDGMIQTLNESNDKLCQVSSEKTAEFEKTLDLKQGELEDVSKCLLNKENEAKVLVEENELKAKEISAAYEEIETKELALTEKEEKIRVLEEEKFNLTKKCDEGELLHSSKVEHIVKLEKDVENWKKHCDQKEEVCKLLKDERDTLSREWESSSSQVEMLDKEIAQLSKEIEDLRDCANEKDKETNMLAGENATLKESVATGLEELGKKSLELVQSKERIVTLESNLKDADEVVNEKLSLENKLDDAEKILDETKRKVNVLDKRVEELAQEVSLKEVKISELIVDKDRIESDKEILLSEKCEKIDRYSDSIEELEEKFTSKEEECESLKQLLKHMEKRVSETNEELHSIKGNLKDQEEQNMVKDEEIDSYQKSLKELEMSMSNKEEKLCSYKELVQAQEEEVHAKEEAVNSLKMALKDLHEATFVKEEEIGCLRALVKDQENQILIKEKEFISSQEAFKDHDNKMLEKDEKLVTVERQKEALEKEISEKNEIISDVRNDVSNAENKCDELEKRLEESKENLTCVSKKVEDLELELKGKHELVLELEEKADAETKKRENEAEQSQIGHDKLLTLLKDKENELDDLRLEAKKTCSNLKKKSEQFDKLLSAKEKELKQKCEELEKLELDLGGQKYDREALFEAMADDVRKLTDKVDCLETKNGKLDEEIWERNAEIEQVSQDKIKLENEKKLLVGRIDEVEKEKQDLKEENRAALKAKDDKIKKYSVYVTEIQSKMENYRRRSRDSKRRSPEVQMPASNEQSAVRHGMQNLNLETPTASLTPLKRSKPNQGEGHEEDAKKSRVLFMKQDVLPDRHSPIATRTRRKMAKKESPPRKKPYPKNKPESISDGSDSESENRVKEAENVQVDIRRKEPQKRIGLSPAKTNVPQTQREGSKFKGMRLAASSKYDFDVTKDKKKPVKLKSLKDLTNGNELTEDQQDCKVQ